MGKRAPNELFGDLAGIPLKEMLYSALTTFVGYDNDHITIVG
jgi:hypothetical protein